MIVTVTLFGKLETVKDLFRPLYKKHPLTVNMLKEPKLLQYEHESTFILFFHHSARACFEKHLPQLYETLGVFPLTANDKYPFRDCENFACRIQMQLSLKKKTFF